MQVMLEIPDDIAKQVGDTSATAARKMLEAYALAEYNERRLGHFGVQRLLGLESWQDTENFLRDNHAPVQYGIAEVEEDLRRLERILGPA
jgi:hypothetical protein